MECYPRFQLRIATGLLIKTTSELAGPCSLLDTNLISCKECSMYRTLIAGYVAWHPERQLYWHPERSHTHKS
jgi:hypothetical protein